MKSDALDTCADSTFVLFQVLKMQKAVAQCLTGGFELEGGRLCHFIIIQPSFTGILGRICDRLYVCLLASSTRDSKESISHHVSYSEGRAAV